MVLKPRNIKLDEKHHQNGLSRHLLSSSYVIKYSGKKLVVVCSTLRDETFSPCTGMGVGNTNEIIFHACNREKDEWRE